jgi:hypothetical protein
MLNDISTAGIKNPHTLAELSIFVPVAGSPLIDAGYNVQALKGGIDVKRDFAGSKVPQGKGFDIGAVEFSAEK